MGPGFGGNSKCWMGGTTRMMPGDFELKSRYGVGTDWPFRYDELETHYCDVEETMQISGPSDSPMPRSPIPLPPHRFSDPDALLKKRFPDGWYQIGHLSRERAHRQARCLLCDRLVRAVPGRCQIHDSERPGAYLQGPRVTLRLSSEGATLDTQGGAVSGVNYLRDGLMERDQADLVVLGASALFNPHIMLRSGCSIR